MTYRSLRPVRAGESLPGVLALDNQGKDRYARLKWQHITVFERIPLHFWKMGPAAAEMETRRITKELIKKLVKVFGSAPQEIVGEGE